MASSPSTTSSPSSMETTITASTSSNGIIAVKKRCSIEKPRPLLLNTTSSSSSNRTLSTFELSSVENTLSLLENVAHNLSGGNYDYPTVTTAIINLSASLKSWGPQLEVLYKEQVDKCQIILRNAARDEKLEMKCRLHLLEIIELRAMNWKANDSLTNYYKQKIALLENNGRGDYSRNYAVSGSCSAPILCSGPPTFPSGNIDILSTSGKYGKPTKIPGKNTFKDEVVIRNADSGKVMGVKGRRVHVIEGISDTIISFQRVNPGSKDRLVQIMGPNEANIEKAKALMEDTIIRNQSPSKERLSNISSTTAENEGKPAEYKYTIYIGGNKSVKISGSDLDIIKTAKIVLEEYFEETINNDKTANNKKKDDKKRLSGNTKVGVIRTPLFPGASKTVFDDANENEEVKNRRAGFAKTNEIRENNNPSSVLKYDRKILYEIADHSMSKSIPNNWEVIIETFPDIARKIEHCSFEGKRHYEMGMKLFSGVSVIDYGTNNEHGGQVT